MRKAYLCDFWNVFDIIVVSFSTVGTLLQIQTVFNPNMSYAESAAQIISFLLLFRLFRLIRFSQPLKTIVQGVLAALALIGWVVIIVTAMLFVCACFLTRQTGQHVDPNNLEYGELKEFYGTVGKSMLTLFQLMTLENWTDIAHMHIKFQPTIWFFYVVYIICANLLLFSIITATIIEQVMETSRRHEMDTAKKLSVYTDEIKANLVKIFKMSDYENDGILSLDEFKRALNQDNVIRMLNRLDVAVVDAEELFAILDENGDGGLTQEEFVEGCLRIKGSAKSKHLLWVQADVSRFRAELANHVELLEVLMRRILSDVDPKHELSLNSNLPLSLQTISRITNLPIQKNTDWKGLGITSMNTNLNASTLHRKRASLVISPTSNKTFSPDSSGYTKVATSEAGRTTLLNSCDWELGVSSS
eukprot:GHVL01034781.1.p1 GENE.GHVL01034781.1~~GHVL01034781.1.p1  ORF type:complete len:453 (-),score=51.73 GHVL01034781.1:2342-3592(-)